MDQIQALPFRRAGISADRPFDVAKEVVQVQAGKVEDLHSRLVDLEKAQHQSTNGGPLIPATFLRVTVSL
jgi:hypothetical protein